MLRIVALLTFASTAALAQDKVFEPSAKERAAALVAQGRESGKAGDYAKALEHFKEALQVFPEPSNHCYVGLAYARLKQWTQAHFAFEQCRALAMQDFPGWSEPILADVERALHDGRFARVEVTTNPVDTQIAFSALGAGEVFDAPATLYLPLGVHKLTVMRKGFRPETVDIALQTTRRYPVYVVLQPEPESTANPELTPEPPLPPSEPPAPMSAMTLPAETVAAAVEPDESHVGAWLALSSGVAAAIAGGMFHVLAVDTSARAAKKLDTDPRYAELIEKFETQRTLAYAGYGLGVVGLGLGVVLLW